MRISNARILGSVSFGALAVAAFPAVAFAQADTTPVDCASIPNEVERNSCLAEAANEQPGPVSLPEGGAPSDQNILVTGSRIARPNFDTLQPAVIIDSQQIENRGFETLGQAINEQPSFGIPGASPVGAQAGSFGAGQSFVNFLGLGDQRTLVLVNGRRFVSSNTASIFGPSNAGVQVDLNSINTRLVERVETIAIGGAPIYGSDAIAGTVNVILRRDFEGIELDGQYGISEFGDAPNYRFRGIAGTNFAGDRGNVVVSGEYNRGRGLLYNQRPLLRAAQFEADCRPEDNAGFSTCLFFNRRIPSISETGAVVASELAFGFPLSPEQYTNVQVFGFPDVDGNGIPGTYADVFLAFVGPGGFQDAVIDPATGVPQQFDVNGNLIPIDFGTRVGGPTDFGIDFSGGNGFNLNNTQQLLTDSERYNANILFSYNLTDNVRVFGEGWYAFSRAVNLREQPVYNSGVFGVACSPDGNLCFDIDNPFLDPAARAVIAANLAVNPFAIDDRTFQVSRANTDLVTGRAESQTEVWRGVLGLDGNFGLFNRDWSWEVVGNYGRAKGEGREPTLVQQNFENAIDAVRDASGNIVCRPGFTNAAIPTLSSTCAPLNLFGTGRASQAARDYITAIADPSSLNTQWIATASVSGPIATLPGGDLSIALGVEHRDEETHFDPGAFFFGAPDPDPTTDANNDGDPANDRVQFGRSVPIFPVDGGYNTNEVFGELTAEIFGPSNDIPFLYRLELHGAARYVDHSAAGGDLTWTVEGRWAPVRDISFRGNFTRAIRAPAITELFNPSSSFFTFATDPCDRNQLNNGPDPATRRANCAAEGIPTTFQALSNQRSFPGAIAGNVELENEKSDAWSVGVVVTPRWIPNLRISADYLDIRLDNAISNFSASQVVAACYDSPDFPNNEFCDRVSRTPGTATQQPFQLNFVETSYFNAAEFRYKGILAAMDYRTDLPFISAESQLGINVSYQYLDTLTTRSTPTSAPTQLDNTLGYPKHQAVANINYQQGPVTVFTTLNYIGAADRAPAEAEGFRQFPRVNDIVFVNMGFAVDVAERFRFHVSVDNVFSQDPPFPANLGSGQYFPGILGTYFRAGASVRF